MLCIRGREHRLKFQWQTAGGKSGYIPEKEFSGGSARGHSRWGVGVEGVVLPTAFNDNPRFRDPNADLDADAVGVLILGQDGYRSSWFPKIAIIDQAVLGLAGNNVCFELLGIKISRENYFVLVVFEDIVKTIISVLCFFNRFSPREVKEVPGLVLGAFAVGHGS